MKMNANFGNVVQEYYVRKIRELNRQRSARIASLKTTADAQAYVAEVQKKVLSSFPMPAKKCPLKPVVTGTADCGAFRIEKVVYYSRPDYPVTSNLYLPKNAKKKNPAVVFLCGHSEEGKASTVYQSCCQGLALHGYVVLAIDPVGQGERWQYTDVKDASITCGNCVYEHNMCGKQLLLAGEYLGAWRAWDAIRGLDYLLTRPEVDAKRIGVTGNSGGGTMTSFVGAVDSRFTMEAPSCYITSWKRNIENELPADIEQIPPSILANGCEMGDLILARAPRPTLLLGQKNDFFDARGLKETYQEVKRVYTLLGAPDAIQLFIGPTSHGYTIENRNAMYHFFNGVAKIKTADDHEPAAVTPLPCEKTYCTKSGQLRGEWKGVKTVFELARDIADNLKAKRKSMDAAALRKFFAKNYRLSKPAEVPYYRTLRLACQEMNTPREFWFGRFAIETEENLLSVLKVISKQCIYHLQESKKAILYIPDHDSQEEMVTMFGSKATTDLCYGLDTRGVGELYYNGCDQINRRFLHPYQEDYHFASCGLMFNDPITIGRVRDIWSAVELLKWSGVEEIKLIASGLGCIHAAIASLMIPEITKAEFFDAPESWDQMMREPILMVPQSAMLPGILKSCDLPDIYQALKKEKKLVIHGYLNNMLYKKM